MIGLAVMGMLTSLGLAGTAAWLGARYAADEDLDPWNITEQDTQPWPAPR